MRSTPDERMFRKHTELEGWQPGLWGENHIVYDLKENGSAMNVCLKCVPHDIDCPCCGEEYSKLSSGYGRTLKNIPHKGLKTTRLHVQTYKYVCQNPDCSMKMSADPLPVLADIRLSTRLKRLRRCTLRRVGRSDRNYSNLIQERTTLPCAHLNKHHTDCLTQLITGMSMCMNNWGASRALGLMDVSGGADAVDRLWKTVRTRDVETVGNNDTAVRKGQTYATSVYAEDHQLIAILDGRTADNVNGWLVAHPKIRRVARDRASAHASAISEVPPEAVQTADRFYLLQNLLKHLEKALKDDLPAEFWAGENGLMKKTS